MGWSWQEYMQTPVAVVEVLAELIDERQRKQDLEANKARL